MDPWEKFVQEIQAKKLKRQARRALWECVESSTADMQYVLGAAFRGLVDAIDKLPEEAEHAAGKEG